MLQLSPVPIPLLSDLSVSQKPPAATVGATPSTTVGATPAATVGATPAATVGATPATTVGAMLAATIGTTPSLDPQTGSPYNSSCL